LDDNYQLITIGLLQVLICCKFQGFFTGIIYLYIVFSIVPIA